MVLILNTLSKHASSAGYTQGMNQIVASLFFHAGEVLAFELTLRALNDYHLKEVHMMKLPGLFFHCEILNILLKEELLGLYNHFNTKKATMIMIASNWIMCLMT